MGRLRISKNTLYVHIPQHIAFFFAIAAVVMGHASPLWFLLTYATWIIIGYFGFSVFYHRYFAHRAFEMPRHWEVVWGYLGLLVGRGSPINLASLHCAEHHIHADTELDPHSPSQGMLWSWFLWSESHTFKVAGKFSRHLIKDPYIRFLDRHYLRIFWLTFGLLAILDWRIACFGMMGAGVLHFHIEGAVSTFCHLSKYGTQDFPTNDNSRNVRGVFNWLVLGTGLHNSHHANPTSYHYALQSGDFDLAKYVVPIFMKKR